MVKAFYDGSDDSSLYWTTSLPLATYISLKVPISKTKVKAGTYREQMEFGFINNEEVNDLVGGYEDGSAVVEPQEFYRQLHSMRLRINEVIKK